jgi:hypothetical protein
LVGLLSNPMAMVLEALTVLPAPTPIVTFEELVTLRPALLPWAEFFSGMENH